MLHVMPFSFVASLHSLVAKVGDAFDHLTGRAHRRALEEAIEAIEARLAEAESELGDRPTWSEAEREIERATESIDVSEAVGDALENATIEIDDDMIEAIGEKHEKLGEMIQNLVEKMHVEIHARRRR